MTSELYHFIGIGGIGMSGLAKILLSRGAKVTGSDIAASYVTEALQKQGASVHIGHSEHHVTDGATVIFTSDISKENPEFLAAQQKAGRLLHRSDLLVELMSRHKILAIAGTHGKTTTTALLTHVLKVAGWDPAFMVGGMIKGVDINASDGKSDYFVVEADESDGTFLKYDFHSAIVTNINTDHIAHWGSFDNVKKGFSDFCSKAQNNRSLVFCIDDPIVAEMGFTGVSYGFSEKAEFRLSHFSQDGFMSRFDLGSYKAVEVQLTGKHNALNAAAVFALALSIGVDETKIREGLKTFPGVKRRMDKKGEVQNILLLDDYAHHPTEIQATLKAARRVAKERRLIALFQPHRFSRMRYVLDELPGAFEEADCIIVTDLFTANEKPVEGVTTERVIEIIKESHTVDVHYMPRKELVEKLHQFLRPHDVLITLGAGDITKVGGDLVEKFSKIPAQKYKVGLLFGGMNCEHEISIRSAKNFVDHLDPTLYDLHCFHIGLDGRFSRATTALQKIEEPTQLLDAKLFEELLQMDLFIPVLHGPYGEDGIIQGFLETLQKPYVGCDVRSCAVSMDKVMSKSMAREAGIQTAAFHSCDRHEWLHSREAFLAECREVVGLPCFIKPSHLGSSVGITKVEKEAELEKAIDRAFQYDTHVLIEKGIEKPREIEFAVLGNHEIQVPPPGEILSHGEVYTYEAKYTKGGFEVTGAAELSDEKIQEGCALAEKIFRKIGCQGLARVDFFLDKEGKYWFNEINPLPGFTSISLYPQIWARLKSTSWLMDRFIVFALQRRREQEKIFRFSSQKLARA